MLKFHCFLNQIQETCTIFLVRHGSENRIFFLTILYSLAAAVFIIIVIVMLNSQKELEYTCIEILEKCISLVIFLHLPPKIFRIFFLLYLLYLSDHNFLEREGHIVIILKIDYISRN